MKYSRFLVILLAIFSSEIIFAQSNVNALLNTINSGYNNVMGASKTAAVSKTSTSSGKSSNNAAALTQAKMLGVDPSIIEMLMGKEKTEEEQEEHSTIDKYLASQSENSLLLESKMRQDSMQAILDSIQADKEKNKEIDESNKIYGHAFFTKENLSLYMVSTDGRAPDSYILGPGDELLISVWGYADYNNKLTVGSDGYIQESEFGRLYVKGMSFGAVKALIGKRLSNFINPTNTKYEISLNYSKSIDVNLVGELIFPGTYKIPAINSVYNAINAASGVSKIGSVRRIEVRRDGKTQKIFDLYQFLFNPIPMENFYLQKGDFIYVPTAEKLIEIQGAVRRPHIYELKGNEGLRELIAFTGGFASDAFKKNIQITRFIGDKVEIINVNYEEIETKNGNFELKDGDKISISTIPGGIENASSISGSVRFPGKYEIKEGYRISDLIIAAGGIKYDAYIDRGYIKRILPNQTVVINKFSLKNILADPTSPDNLLLKKDDIVEIFSYSNFIEKFRVSIKGSVLNPTDMDYTEGMTLNDLLFYAGGLKVEAANSKIEISRIMESDSAQNGSVNYIPQYIIIKTIPIDQFLHIADSFTNFRLLPMDMVNVRKTPILTEQLSVTLQGEVLYAGVYSLLNKNEKVLDIIKRAGGLTPYAYIEGATLVRTENAQQKTVFELKDAFKNPASIANLILKNGDQINIPTINQLIGVKGAIRYPGLDSLQTISGKFVPGKSAKWYIKNYAGGFRERAKKRSTIVQYPNGKVEFTKNFLGIKNYPTIDNEGAVVTVDMKKPKQKGPSGPREPVSLNILLPSLIAGITSALSTSMLILFLK